MTTVCASTKKMDERREQRINAVLRRFDILRFTPSGQHIQDGEQTRELQNSRVEWSTEGNLHTICFSLDDDEPVEQITSELRACGLVVSTQ